MASPLWELAMTIQQTSTFPPIVATDLVELRSRLTGRLHLPGEPGYEEARQSKNFATLGRFPAAIVRPTSSQDVAEAIRFAWAQALPLSVKSGGHSVTGAGVVDGGITIDMGAMKGVTIDPVTRTARVQPAVTSAELAGPAHAYGLALSTGDTSSVALGGLTTGGGIGFMVRKYGLAIDNLISAEVVTADGRILRASRTQNVDLFWAIRGGGGNFGVVTEFELRLAPVGSIIGGALVLPARPEVIRGYLDYVTTAPDDLTTITNLMHAPPAPFIPEDKVGEPVVVVLVCWTGDPAEAEAAIAPLRALAEPIADVVGPMPYPVIYQFTEAAAQPHGAAVRSTFAHMIPDAAIEAMLDDLDHATSPFSMIQLRGLGGAMNRVPSDAMAFPHRDKEYFVAVLGLWFDPAEDGAPHVAWAEKAWSHLQAIRSGNYVNFLDNEGEERILDAYTQANYDRLADIKRRYDPANIFAGNQNIKPAR